tara:strand:- start:255 stop:677 length:423 start_codon:yes stop_codon:yes gene_type:complete
MAIRFEKQKDLDRENKATDFFCNMFEFDKKKLGDNDIDFEIWSKGQFKFNLEVKGRLKKIKDAYPLPVSVKKLTKIQDKKKQGVILWACEDGIIFSRIEKLKGEIRVGGRIPRKGAVNDIEYMAYFNKADNLKEITYECD